jgi:hypothetical protein
MAVAAVAELVGERGDPRLGVGETLQRHAQPELVPVGVQREAGRGSEDPREVVLRRAKPGRDLRKSEALAQPLAEELLRLVREVAMSR